MRGERREERGESREERGERREERRERGRGDTGREDTGSRDPNDRNIEAGTNARFATIIASPNSIMPIARPIPRCTATPMPIAQGLVSRGQTIAAYATSQKSVVRVRALISSGMSAIQVRSRVRYCPFAAAPQRAVPSHQLAPQELTRSGKKIDDAEMALQQPQRDVGGNAS